MKMKIGLTGLTRRTLLGVMALGGMMSMAQALDFAATPESVWAEYVKLPQPTPLTEARLRLSLDMAVLGLPSRSLNKASPMGVRMGYWDRVIARHGLPLVAADYVIFLRELKAELTREQQQ